jgi:hypothetical protein
VVGFGANTRFITGSADNGQGKTRITVACTAGITPPWPNLTFIIQDYWGWSDPNYNLPGSYPQGSYTIVDSNHIDLVNLPYKPIPPGFTPMLVDGMRGMGWCQGGFIKGGSSEGNGCWIWADNGSNMVIQAMYDQLHSADWGNGVFNETAASIIIRRLDHSVIQAVGGGGQGQLGFIYQVPGTSHYDLNVSQISGWSGIAVQGSYPAGSTTFKLAPYIFSDKLFPDWLNGSTVQAINGGPGASVPGGTKVVSVNPGANTFTLNNGISGSLSDNGSPYSYPWIQFVGQGGVYLR